MIYITHRLPEVLAICDRATVLRDGRVAAEIARDDFDEERFIFAMSGQRLQRLFPTHAAPAGARPLLEVRAPHRRRPPRRRLRRQRRQLLRRARARSSDSPACSAPAAARSCTASTAAFPPRARSASTAAPSRSARRATPAPPASRSSPRTASATACSSTCRSAPTSPSATSPPRRGRGIVRGERGAQRHPRRDARAQRQGAVAAGVGRPSLRRQPAEAAVRPRADARPASPAARRADQGRRCGNPPRDLSARRRARRQGRRPRSSSRRSSRR